MSRSVGVMVWLRGSDFKARLRAGVPVVQPVPRSARARSTVARWG